jgi:hypothetical protein
VISRNRLFQLFSAGLPLPKGGERIAKIVLRRRPTERHTLARPLLQCRAIGGDRLLNGLNATEAMKQGLLRIDAPAREYVERSAASAQKTLTGIHEAATSLSGSLESAILHAVETNARVNRNIAELVYKNTQASIGLIQTLSGVKTFDKAFQVYADYLKNMNETNLASYRGSAEYVRERVTEGATTARDNLSKAFPRAA